MPRRRLIAACAAVALALTVVAAVGGRAAERPAVVAVRVWTASGPATLATGVVVGRGRVVTVDHVLAGARRIEVQGAGGVPRPATVLRRRPQLDLALLGAPGVTGPLVRVAGARAGARLKVLTMRDGTVRTPPARLRRRFTARLVDQPGRPRRPSLDLAVAVARGDSGAPVVDRDGAVVGIVYARSTRRDDRAYATGGEALRALAR